MILDQSSKELVKISLLQATTLLMCLLLEATAMVLALTGVFVLVVQVRDKLALFL